MINQQNISSRAWLELFLLGIIWGGVFLAIAIALKDVSPLTLVAFRTGIAAPILWLYVWFRKLPLPRGLRVWRALLVMGVLNNVLPFALLNYGQTLLDSGLTSIFNAGTAVFGILVAALFFTDERLTKPKTLGVLLGVTGIAITVGYDSISSFDLTSLAQLACIAATLCYALASVWARKNLSDLTPACVSAGMVTCSTLVMIPLVVVFEGLPSFDLNPQTWLAIIYTASIATAFAYLLYFRILAMAGAANTMLVTLIVPPIAIMLGAVVLQEILPLRSFIGFGFIAFGLMVIDGRIWKHCQRVFSS